MAEDRMLSDEILLGLIKANSGGGGGGTSNYNDLSNKPQIGGVTLSGNKSASDLGLVAAVDGKGLSTNDYTDADKAIVGGVTAALAGKQDALTAGNYVSITNNGIINVTQSIGVYDVYSYELMSTGVGITIQLTKKINNVTISTQDIRNEDYSPTNKLTVDGLFELWYDMSNFYWHYKLLVDSEEHQKNEDINWYYRTMADYTEIFNVSQDSSTDLATKGDVEIALANKQDKTDNNLETTDKTVVGAINEHEGDIDSLKSGLTNYQVQNDLNLEVPNRKNLISGLFQGTFEGNGIRYTYNNRVASENIMLISKGTYTVSANTSTSGKTLECGIRTWASDATDGTNRVLTDSGWKNLAYTFTLSSDSYVSVSIRYNDDSDISVSEITAQLELGSTATSYAPYIPSVESRIEAVESGLKDISANTHLNKDSNLDTLQLGWYGINTYEGSGTGTGIPTYNTVGILWHVKGASNSFMQFIFGYNYTACRIRSNITDSWDAWKYSHNALPT